MNCLEIILKEYRKPLWTKLQKALSNIENNLNSHFMFMNDVSIL